HPAMAPTVPHVAILAKVAGVYARPPALGTKASACAAIAKCKGTAPTVPRVATQAKAAGICAWLSAFDAHARACTEADERGRFAHPLCSRSRRALPICHRRAPSIRCRRTLSICHSRSVTLLMVVAHITSPTHPVNEIGTDLVTLWALCDS